MKVRKRQNGIYELRKAESRINRNRNRILMLAVALGILILFSAFSIAKGKMVVSALKSLREDGTSASVYLEKGTREQHAQLEQLDYAYAVGLNNLFGAWRDENATMIASCEVLDETGYEKIVKPAYTNVTGHYPKAENEVMLSVRMLKEIGIKNPRLGMELSVPVTFYSWSVNKGYELKESFVLSGYYQDYVDPSEEVPIIYFSEAYLAEKEYAKYPANLLIRYKTSWWNASQMEQQLNQDIELSDVNQQFIGKDSSVYAAMEEFVGGYGIAALCILVVLLSIYLLIYNVLSISLNKDVQLYGRLMALGTTRKQIRKLVSGQCFRILIKGVLFGSAASVILGYVGFPLLFQELFLQQKGTIEIGVVFYPEILGAAIVFVFLVMSLAGQNAAGRLKKLSPIEAHGYGITSKTSHKKTHSTKGAGLWNMAWRNLFLSKRKFFITVLSLFMGCEAALFSGVIASGTDPMNILLQKPDFTIQAPRETVEKYMFYEIVYDFPDGEGALLNEDFLDRLMEIDGVDQNSREIVYGAYGGFDDHQNFIQPSMTATYGTLNSNNGVTLQVVEDAYIEKIETYTNKKGYQIDTKSLKNGSGILILHKHELSELLLEEAKGMVGQPAEIYADDEDFDYDHIKGKQEFICSGYLDTTEEDFPPLDMSWNGDGINYFLISKKGFERLGQEYQKQIFKFSIDAKEGKEASVKQELIQLIGDKNKEFEEFNIYQLISTSDEMNEKQHYIKASRTVMTALSLILLLIGAANYCNVVLTNMIQRKQEFITMENIGMTKKQLKKMLVAEGLYYCIILVGSLLSIGTLCTMLLGIAIKSNVSYFRYVFPLKEFAVIAIILVTLCVCIPAMAYRSSKADSPPLL